MIYLFCNPPINFHVAQKTARKKTVLIWWRCFVFFRRTVQNFTGKRACQSQEKKFKSMKFILIVTVSRKLEQKALFCLLEKNLTMKDKMRKLWMTVFSSAAGIYLSFEQLVYFIVSKHNALWINSLLFTFKDVDSIFCWLSCTFRNSICDQLFKGARSRYFR